MEYIAYNILIDKHSIQQRVKPVSRRKTKQLYTHSNLLSLLKNFSRCAFRLQPITTATITIRAMLKNDIKPAI